MPEKNVVIVSGVNGVSGRAAAQHWATVPDTKVYGISRRVLPLPEGVEGLHVDLLQPDEVKRKLENIRDVTHLVFGAYIEKRDAAERTAVNVALVKNLLDAVEATSPTLRHVTLYQGSKAYGADLGPFKTPAREEDPRLMPPNFYYDQEDLLRTRQKGRAWHWTVLRPEGTSGFGLGNPMNVAMSIAVYAVISRELGLPLRFPGTEKAYRDTLYNITYAKILAKATTWAGLADSARNEIFNITNGDYFRWQHVWPNIAAMFDLPVADPIRTPLAVYMADKGPLWDAIVRKHNLRPVPYEQVSAWAFADVVLNLEYDTILSTIKARKAGFNECVSAEEMFADFFADLRRERIIP